MADGEVDLCDVVRRHPPGIISLTGGGGKTTLLFTLARALRERGECVICTTTTRMLRPEPSDWLRVSLADSLDAARPSSDRVLFVARNPATEDAAGKVSGYAADAVDALLGRFPGVWIVVEADGAAGRPLKAPAAHEPVVPAATALAVAVIGLGGMEKTFGAENVFRLREFALITGLREGDSVTPDAVARLACRADGMFKSVPAGAARLLVCNQADLPGARGAGVAVARAVRSLCPAGLDGVYVASLQTKGLRCADVTTA